ncbi:MAG TPA: type II secretion system F family protein [Nitrospiria bacterium]|nr:type II secretion system F family protein [Nitrospiria bacterium]
MTALLLFVIYFLVFFSVSWTVRLVTASDRAQAGASFAIVSERARTLSSAIRFPGIARYKKAIDGLNVVAGRKTGPEAFIFSQVISGIAGGFLGGLFFFFAGNGMSALAVGLTLIGLLSGLAYPWFTLRAIVRARQKGMLRELSYFLDLMVLGVEAGMDYGQALLKILDAAPPSPLRQTFEAMSGEIQMGKSRSEAWREFARKCGLPEIQSMTLIFIQADQAGSPVAETLRSLSDGIREERFRHAEKIAYRMPVRLLLPLLGFIFPAVFILLFFPLVVRLLQLL